MPESPRQEIRVWCVIANLVKERPFGPGGEEIRHGTKHFKGGAKLYIIDAYWGMCKSVTVIGHHRKGSRFIKLDIPASYVENLRVKPVYHPKVLQLIGEHFLSQKQYPDKAYAEKICSSIPLWKA
jgi:hypothetical protein